MCDMHKVLSFVHVASLFILCKIPKMNNSSPHRKNLKRYNLPNHIHELTFSCYKHLPLLTSERTCNNLAKSIIKSCAKLDYGIVAYVFMPTRVHLLLLPNKTDYSISDFLRLVKQPVGKKEISYMKWNEPDKLNHLLSGWEKPKYLFWLRGGGYDRNIVETETLGKSMNYIHNNPVRKELVKSAVEWKWSSAKDWLLDEEGIIPVVKSLRL